MNPLSIIALIAAAFSLVIGFATILGEAGYSFDLRRRRSRRRSRDGRIGGRREEDRLTADKAMSRL